MLVVLPDSKTQHILVIQMDSARELRNAKLAEADALQTGMDGYLLESLKLSLPTENKRRVFAIKHGRIPPRFDPHFHAPSFSGIVKSLEQINSPCLAELVSFSLDTWKLADTTESTFRYIEISNVSPYTGEARFDNVLVTEAPSRARMITREGDIIVSLTRPHHGSIAQITPELDGCIASTGFAVIRPKNAGRVDLDYLWCVLRSSMCRQQMLQRASGGNYPAITEQELGKILVPTPSLVNQKIIAAEARRRRDEARKLRAEAEQGWREAKAQFEAALLGEPNA